MAQLINVPRGLSRISPITPHPTVPLSKEERKQRILQVHGDTRLGLTAAQFNKGLRTRPSLQQAAFAVVAKMEEMEVLRNPGVPGSGCIGFNAIEAASIPLPQLHDCKNQKKPGHKGMGCDIFKLCPGFPGDAAEDIDPHPPHWLCCRASEGQLRLRGYCARASSTVAVLDLPSHQFTLQDRRLPADAIEGLPITGTCAHEGEHAAEDMLYCPGDALTPAHLVCVKGRDPQDFFCERVGKFQVHAMTTVRVILPELVVAHASTSPDPRTDPPSPTLDTPGQGGKRGSLPEAVQLTEGERQEPGPLQGRARAGVSGGAPHADQELPARVRGSPLRLRSWHATPMVPNL